MKKCMTISHIVGENIRAHSSSFTIGVPSLPAILGTVHALERLLQGSGFPTIKLLKTGIVYHTCDLRVSREGYYNQVIAKGKPLLKNKKRASFITDPRCDLELSLVIEYSGTYKDDEEALIEQVTRLLHSKIKLAGGNIIKFHPPAFFKISNAEDMQKLTRSLMPGYALKNRKDLVIKKMEEGKDAIDAILDHLKITSHCTQEGEEISWETTKEESGWLVPIAVGFQGITDLGYVKNQRDPNKLHRFAESIVTLGEFVMVYRFKELDDMLWGYKTDLENNLYMCE